MNRYASIDRKLLDDLISKYTVKEVKLLFYLISTTQMQKILAIEDEFKVMCDELKVNLVLSTGGTGFSKRDITPEATKVIIEREAPGICEAIRYFSLQVTKRAMLSRAVSGIRNETLIVNLPGSPKACTEALDFVLDDIKHGIDILLGEVKECSRK